MVVPIYKVVKFHVWCDQCNTMANEEWEGIETPQRSEAIRWLREEGWKTASNSILRPDCQ